jgi:hypothetical protein
MLARVPPGSQTRDLNLVSNDMSKVLPILLKVIAISGGAYPSYMNPDWTWDLIESLSPPQGIPNLNDRNPPKHYGSFKEEGWEAKASFKISWKTTSFKKYQGIVKQSREGSRELSSNGLPKEDQKNLNYINNTSGSPTSP